jgi:hypothetical protein
MVGADVDLVLVDSISVELLAVVEVLDIDDVVDVTDDVEVQEVCVEDASEDDEVGSQDEAVLAVHHVLVVSAVGCDDCGVHDGGLLDDASESCWTGSEVIAGESVGEPDIEVY